MGAIGALCMTFVTLIVLRRGDGWSRAAAAAYSATWVGVGLAQNRHHLGGAQYGVLAVDTVGAIVLLGLALASHHAWIAAASGFQILGVANDLAFDLDHRILPAAKITASYVWGYGALLAVGAGGVRRRRVSSG